MVAVSEGVDDAEPEKKDKETSADEAMEAAGEKTESGSDSESCSEQEQHFETEVSCEMTEEVDKEEETIEGTEQPEEVLPERKPEDEPEEASEPLPNENTTEPPVTNQEEGIPETEENPEAEDVSELEVHEHSWVFESFYQAPTCSNGGLVNQICAHCGETQITGGIPTGEHVYEVETAGDCCSGEVVVCKECNFREVREKDPNNHIDVEDGFCYGCGHKTE